MPGRNILLLPAVLARTTVYLVALVVAGSSRCITVSGIFSIAAVKRKFTIPSEPPPSSVPLVGTAPSAFVTLRANLTDPVVSAWHCTSPFPTINILLVLNFGVMVALTYEL